MSNNFQVIGLSERLFLPYFEMSEDDLWHNKMKWIQVDESPCYPCRVSLEDAKIGERILALSFLHHDVDSPYRSSGPIFVREKAKQAKPEINEVPLMLRLKHRQLSIRGYDAATMMIEAETTQGDRLKEVLSKLLQNSAVQYLQIHNAKPGCFNANVIRA